MPTTSAKLSPTSALLLQGGDDRIKLLDGVCNKYGCRPYPMEDCIDFSSSTATPISSASFARLEMRQQALSAALKECSAEALYAQQLDHLRTQFLALWELPAKTTQMIFSASGTDAHLIAARLAEMLHGSPLHTVMIQGEESGSGVAAALRGRPFSSCTALGHRAPEADAVTITATIDDLHHIALRAPDGTARSRAAMDADFEQEAQRFLIQGLPVLLVAVDVSKTGITTPGIDTLTRMKQRWGEQLTVLIDACQLRNDAASLRAYLNLGCMVAITGSKFFAAPSFCGALLLPSTLAQQLHTKPLPSLLQSYSSAAEWPSDWQGAKALKAQANFGLLLRWEAALYEMQAFMAIPAEAVAQIIATCTDAIEQRLAADAHFIAVDNSADDADADADSANQLKQRTSSTIYPFIPCHLSPQRQALDRQTIEQLYRRLQNQPQENGYRYLLGQPVQCSGAGQAPRWALRLCLSAPMIVAVYHGGATALANLIAQAQACLTAVASTLDQIDTENV